MKALSQSLAIANRWESIVGELRTCLSDVEKSIDQYFRSPIDQSCLRQVPNQLSQMRGIFSILGLDPVTKLFKVMKEKVDEFLEPSFDFDKLEIAVRLINLVTT